MNARKFTEEEIRPLSLKCDAIDYVTQTVVMAELARADSAISKIFSQCWKWSHLIADFCTDEQNK